MKIYVNYWSSRREDERPFSLSVDKEVLELLKDKLIRKATAALSNDNCAEEALRCLRVWDSINDAIAEWESDVREHEQEERNDE